MSRAATMADTYYVTLGIDREVFGVPVDAVLEILDLRPVFRIPEAPSYLAGLIDVRGRAVPVIDLRSKLGLPPVTADANTRIVVLDVPLQGRRLVLGLVAERVFDVIPLAEAGLEPAPDIGRKWHSDYIRGIGRRGDGFVVLLDLACLFSSDAPVLLGAHSATVPTSDATHASAAKAA